MTRPLSPRMIAALREADARWDHAITCDRRTWVPLWRRGLVDIRRGRSTGRHGQTVYNAIVGVTINDEGRAELARLT